MVTKTGSVLSAVKRAPCSILGRTLARASGRRMWRDTRGGVAIIFAFAVVPVSFLSLVMLDYSRASTSRQSLQENLDAATLIAARSSEITQENLDRVGDEALIAQLSADSGIAGLTPVNGRLEKATFTPTGVVISSAVEASYTPIMASMLLKSDANPNGNMKITAKSEVVRSMTRLEIAMVLDTTGSMQGTKISNLKTAATNFINTMEAAHKRSVLPASTPAVRIAIVPFSTTVKVMAPVSAQTYVSATNRGGVPDWLDGKAQAYSGEDVFAAAGTDRFLMLKEMKVSWGGCVEARDKPYDIQDTAPSTGNVDTLFTPFFYPDEPDLTNQTWYNNYLTDGSTSDWKTRERRVQKYTAATPKVGNFNPPTAYGANGTNGVLGPNAWCSMQQLQPLTTNFQSLRTAVDGLVASGETNIPLGLMWGWHAISPNAPLANGSAYNTENLTKVIVLMTDGDNTMTDSGNDNASHYHGYGFNWQERLGTATTNQTTRTTRLNDRMTALCANLKTAKIVIYAVGVGITDSTKLSACAVNSGGKYYDVNATGSNLDTAFSAIAGSIENLRISK